MSKTHPDQWTITEEVGRPAPEAVAALAALPTTQIADSGAPVWVVGPGLHHVAGRRGFCGPAVTVWTRPGDILFVLKAADVVAEGDVLVVDSAGRPDAAVLGDIVCGTLAGAGVAGVVVDGAVRDVAGIDEVGLPTFARGVHPATGSAEGPGAINVDVAVGGVPVRPGDVVRGDDSGVVVVPREHVDEVVARAREVEEREQGWRAALADGATLGAATGIDDAIRARAAAVGAETPLP